LNYFSEKKTNELLAASKFKGYNIFWQRQKKTSWQWFNPSVWYGGNGILAYTNVSNAADCIIIGRVGAYCGSVFYENSNLAKK
jgi:hypothetical protein